MATPKRKTSASKRNMRRSHDGLKNMAMSQCPNCGDMMRPHHMCPHCGYYKGREIESKDMD